MAVVAGGVGARRRVWSWCGAGDLSLLFRGCDCAFEVEGMLGAMIFREKIVEDGDRDNVVP